MMSIRSLADFNGVPWAVLWLVGTATVTAQGQNSWSTRRARGEDFYLATTGDLDLATTDDFSMATDMCVGCCAHPGTVARPWVRRWIVERRLWAWMPYQGGTNRA